MNLRKEAQGRLCMVRIPHVCNHNPETTVLAHLGGAGMGLKQPDQLGAWACSACHDAIDGRSRPDYTKAELRLMHLEGMVRTLQVLIDEGKVK